MSSDGEEGWSSDPETNGSQLMRQPSKPPPVDELVLVSPYPAVKLGTSSVSLSSLAEGKPVVLHLYTGCGGCWPCAQQMDQWAVEYGDQATFICVGCAGPALATTFGNELQLANCVNTYVPRGAGPFWGQLGCSGFIILDGELNVVCPETLAYMQVRGKAFEHVETLLDVLIESTGGSPPKRAKLDSAPAAAAAVAGSEGGSCGSGGGCGDSATTPGGGGCGDAGSSAALEAEAQAALEAGEATEAVAPLDYIQSVQVQVLDDEHEECEAALCALQASPTAENVKAVLEVYSAHFAHEEALLDEHMWPAAASGKSVGAFDADANARTSHFADHERMLSKIRAELMDAVLSGGSKEVQPAFVNEVLRDFEQHANKYDMMYAERLSAALGPEEAD